MGIILNWHNSEKTILYIKFQAQWDWNDYWTMDNQFKKMARSVSHSFANIVDVSETGVPSIFIPHLGRIAKLSRVRPENLDCTVVVGSSGLLGNAAKIFTDIYKRESQNIFFATSIESALVLIEERQAETAVVQKRPLGKTGLFVSVMGLGLASLGRPGYINLGHGEDLNHTYDPSKMEANAHTVLDTAWRLGIRYFDTARSYGSAEAFLSRWINKQNMTLSSMVIGSKWGYRYTADWQVSAKTHEVKEHTLENLLQQTDESMALLGKRLNLYQIHSATLDSGVLDNNAVLNELAHLRNQGLLIGLSTSGLNQSETIYKALDIVYDGKPLFSTVQATWNLLEQSTTNALVTAYENGLGIIVKEALANGRLTSKNNHPAFKKQLDLLKTAAAEQKTTIDALALAAVVAQPWVTVVLSGATTVEQLQSNIHALDINWSDSLREKVAPLVETAEVYWQTRGALDWN